MRAPMPGNKGIVSVFGFRRILEVALSTIRNGFRYACAVNFNGFTCFRYILRISVVRKTCTRCTVRERSTDNARMSTTDEFTETWLTYFSMFVTQMAMPTPFLVANFDQKKPTRWAPLINYWKAMVLSHPLNQYIICHISYEPYYMNHMIWYETYVMNKKLGKAESWNFCEPSKGINSTILYSSNSNFSSNWIIQENWLVQFACNHCWRSCN